MPLSQNTTLGLWTGRTTFFWAATAATIGLGNLWQFPWLANRFGGGYFVLMYLACLLLITLPLMLAETALGRHTRHSMVLAMESVARSRRRSPRWGWVGRLSILSGFLVLSMTLVIGAICLAYVFHGALGHFAGADVSVMTDLLLGLVEDPHEYRVFMAWHLFMVLLVGAVAFRGARDGVEHAVRLVMPLFLLLLGVLLWWSASEGVALQALDAVVGFRADDVSLQGAWMALSHAFYTLGLGLGVWAVFGAMMAPGTPFKRSVFAVALVDTLVGILAGVVIYGVAQSVAGAGDAQGFALVFVVLPVGLGAESEHQLLSVLLFTAVTLVAWTSAVALLESVVGWLREWVVAPRAVSVLLVLVFAWLAGLVSLFSFNIWANVELAGLTPFRWVELVTSGILIPAVVAALAIFLGWRGSPGYLAGLLGGAHEWLALIWFWSLRYVLPVVIVVIGVSYIVTSWQVLCEAGDMAWCAQPAHEVAPPLKPGPGTPAAPPVASDVVPEAMLE